MQKADETNRAPISMKEIARLSGTSVATVSRVINKNGRFSKETEKRVLDIIHQYGYHPNAIAKSLRKDKTRLIGVIVPDITHSFFSGVYRTIETELFRYGYISILCDTNESEELVNTYTEQLRDMHFSGLIYMNGNQFNDSVSCPATVYLDRYPLFKEDGEEVYFISSDNFHAGYLAAEALVNAGRKNLTIISIDHQLAAQQQRHDGFCSYLIEHSSLQLNMYVLNVERSDYLKGYEITQSLLEQHPDTDAVFYTSDILAYGGLQCFREKGIDVPQQISVVGMDDLPLSRTFNLTTVRQDSECLGRLAARSVVDLIEGRSVDTNQILPVTLIKRGTV